MSQSFSGCVSSHAFIRFWTLGLHSHSAMRYKRADIPCQGHVQLTPSPSDLSNRRWGLTFVPSIMESSDVTAACDWSLVTSLVFYYYFVSYIETVKKSKAFKHSESRFHISR